MPKNSVIESPLQNPSIKFKPIPEKNVGVKSYRKIGFWNLVREEQKGITYFTNGLGASVLKFGDFIWRIINREKRLNLFM